MKFMKRAGIFKANNVSFNPTTIAAYSYGWWKFVGIVEGRVIFNNHRYSNSTNKHQWKVRSLMRELGITIDLEIPVPAGLPGTYGRMGSVPTDTSLQALIETAEEYLCNQYLREMIARQERYQRAKARKLARAEQAEMNRQREEQRPHLSLVGGL